MEEKTVDIARVVPVLLAHDLTYFPAVVRVVVSCASNHVLISKGMADRDVLCASILSQSVIEWSALFRESANVLIDSSKAATRNLSSGRYRSQTSAFCRFSSDDRTTRWTGVRARWTTPVRMSERRWPSRGRPSCSRCAFATYFSCSCYIWSVALPIYCAGNFLLQAAKLPTGSGLGIPPTRQNFLYISRMTTITSDTYMPPPCNVIFKGRGYRFEGPVPPYTPYLKRKTSALLIMAASVVGFALSIYYKSELGGTLPLLGVLTVALSVACIGFLWYRKASSAVDVFASAPRNCSLTSSDSDVFYARK